MSWHQQVRVEELQKNQPSAADAAIAPPVAVVMSAAAAAAAEARATIEAMAMAEREKQTRELNERRARARLAATKDFANFLNAIRISTRLGKTSTYFGAVQEDDEFYWEFIAADLRAGGFDVDIEFLAERNQFNKREYLVNSTAARAIELVNIHGNIKPPVCCCGLYKKPSFYERGGYTSKIKNQVEDVTIWRCWILELLWMLTIVGPMFFGVCSRFGCCACVCDNARTRMTCNAPHSMDSVVGPFVGVGAVWHVRVSWDRVPASTIITGNRGVIPVATMIEA